MDLITVCTREITARNRLTSAAIRTFILVTILFNLPPLSPRIKAQISTIGSVAILPFIDHTQDHTLGNEVYQRFRSSMNPGKYLSILDEERMNQYLARRSVAEILQNPLSIKQFSIMTGIEYIIGGVVSESPDGSIQVSIMVFSGDEQAVLSTETRQYPDSGAVLGDIEDLGAYHSQPKHYVPRDSAFFYSLILPGSGQFSLGYKDHALISWGTISAALLYGLLNPQPDMYKYRREAFWEEWNTAEGQWHFYANGEELLVDEYLRVRAAAEKRAENALNERNAFQKRRNISRWLVGSLWLLNLADTLILSKRVDDGSAFFSLVSSVEPGHHDNSAFSIGIRLHINLGRSSR